MFQSGCSGRSILGSLADFSHGSFNSVTVTSRQKFNERLRFVLGGARKSGTLRSMTVGLKIFHDGIITNQDRSAGLESRHSICRIYPTFPRIVL